MFSPELISIFSDLQTAANRAAGARALAAHTGVSAVLVFSRDPAIDVFLPVVGLPQTLPDGAKWQRFLGASARGGCGLAKLPTPECAEPQLVFTLADTQRQCILAFVREPDMQQMAGVGMLLPLLGPGLAEERAALVAQGQTHAALLGGIKAEVLNQALERSRQHLRSAWRRTYRELSARRSSERTLLQNEQRRSQFMHLLTHQLRDPLALIANALKIIDRISPGASGPVRLAPQIIDEQTRRLQPLVDDQLDVTHMEETRFDMHRQSCPIGDSVRLAASRQAAQISARGQQLRQHGLEQAARVWADPEHLLAMIDAQLDNAGKLAPGAATWGWSCRSSRRMPWCA